MPSATRLISLAVGVAVTATLGGSPVAAQLAGQGGASAPAATKSSLAKGRWVIGALIDPFGGPGAGSSGPALGGASITGGSSPGTNSTTTTTFGTSGTVGYMVLPGFDVGARLAYAQTSFTSGAFTTSASANGLGLYARYWLPVSESGAFQFSAQYTARDASSGNKSTNYGPILGYSIFLNRFVTVDMLLPVEFSSTSCTGCPTTTYTSYGVSVGLSVFVP
jgi:hypothetical protein